MAAQVNLELFMSAPDPTPEHTTSASAADAPVEIDGVEAVVPLIPIVLPVVGAVLMFLLAFIAVAMA
jgi:hypothetical protein